MTKAATDKKPSTEADGRITDADIERCRQQIGIAKYSPGLPYNLEASIDAFRHFAFSCGDDNPLWHDEAYASTTRWGAQIAPPMFFVSTGISLAPKPDADTKALFRGLFKNVGKYYSGAAWTWWAPLQPGGRIYKEHTTADVIVRDSSSFSGRRTVTEVYRHLYVSQTGIPLAQRDEEFVNAERGGSKTVSKHSDVKRQHYTPEHIAEIDAVYAAEELRGSQPRYWEDVEVGDRITPVAKGPLTMVETIAYHMGQGLSGYGIGPLRYNWRQRQRMPAFFNTDKYGVFDVMQRVHWDHERAQDLGLPTSYDYGQMRANWLAHLVTNWMGDDGWLWKLDLQTRKFNFMGDTTICSGTVSGKREEDGRYLVDLELHSVNQRGEDTCPGHATVLLPTRAEPVLLPEPPEAQAKRAAEMARAVASA